MTTTTTTGTGCGAVRGGVTGSGYRCGSAEDRAYWREREAAAVEAAMGYRVPTPGRWAVWRMSAGERLALPCDVRVRVAQREIREAAWMMIGATLGLCLALALIGGGL